MPHNPLLDRLLLDPFAHGLVCMLVAYLVVPTQFVKVIYQETGEAYSAIIIRYLRARKFRSFYAGAHIYALRQLISSFAFGIAQWLFLLSLSYYPITNFMLLISWECFLAGIIETIITAYSEIKEIAANKGALMKRKEAVSDIFVPLLIRNILANAAPIAAYEITKNSNSLWMNIAVSTLLSIAVSVLTMPFDLVATQNCGSEVPMTWIGRLHQNFLVEKKFHVAFNGLTMRILQIVPFSVAHSLVMLFLEKFTI